MKVSFLHLWGSRLWICLALYLTFLRCGHTDRPIESNDFDSLQLNDFVEKDFPFISTSLDARNLGDHFPKDNLVARGLAFPLSDDVYACFDTDLLRWSVGWTGPYLPMVLLPQVSYHDFFDKSNDVPRIKGHAVFANGSYPGWSSQQMIHQEVRPEHQNREGFYWGAIPTGYGRWDGVYLHGEHAVLTYSIGSTRIHELPGAIASTAGPIFTRSVKVAESGDVLYLNAAEVTTGASGEENGPLAYIRQSSLSDTVTAVAAKADDGQVYPVRLVENRYLSVEFPASTSERTVTVFVWKGPESAIGHFNEAVRANVPEWPAFETGGPSRWKDEVYTKGQCAADTTAFVIDVLTLPLPNPWGRDLRPADIAFLTGTKAAVVTLSGDVWLVDGISQSLDRLQWTRFASGLFEPMSIAVLNQTIYVYGKGGITALHDLNNDGEADFYENFSNAMEQSIESREWATDRAVAPDGSFYIAKGGTAIGGPGVTPQVTPGFRAGSNQSGTVVNISPDGLGATVVATGFRVPYLGIRDDGLVSATDQQGNFVPSTAIYLVDQGDFFGVPATRHSASGQLAKQPLAWIPHRVDRSASSQIWVTGDKMGPLNGALLHLSFGRPGIFNVLIDTTSQGLQGGVTYIRGNYVAPTINGAMGPSDGQLYIAGLNLFGSNSTGIAAIQRLRYTGKPSYMLSAFKAGSEGVVLMFDSPLDEVSARNIANYQFKRWNYKRTEQYGSGHFRLDGTPGEEVLPVLDAYVSPDRTRVFLLVPDMKAVDQVEVMYDLRAHNGKLIKDGFWFSMYHTEALDLARYGFGPVDFGKLNLSREEIDAMIKTDFPVTVDRGRELFATKGCLGCHSTGRRTEGMYGPPFQGIYGSKVELADGATVTVDEAYLRESILEPSKKVVKGYQPEMPSYQGVLSDADIESIILYITTLYR
ncbi:cytochrome c [Parapedobacter pyrenivorans]|uniref:cytochrome c n=1 Tax=Parapedobacter pyrenivorans TaxID=1305674 RepID=UPI0033405008